MQNEEREGVVWLSNCGSQTRNASACASLLRQRRNLVLGQPGDFRHHGGLEALGEHVAGELPCLFLSASSRPFMMKSWWICDVCS